jgi:hypothetical protein
MAFVARNTKAAGESLSEKSKQINLNFIIKINMAIFLTTSPYVGLLKIYFGKIKDQILLFKLTV